MHQARALLDDYIKGDSAFWRFMYFHWNRNHVEEVTKLVKYIDTGLITNRADLVSELELIDKTNEVGSLAKRINFLMNKASIPVVKNLECDDQDEVEMKCLTF